MNADGGAIDGSLSVAVAAIAVQVPLAPSSEISVLMLAKASASRSIEPSVIASTSSSSTKPSFSAAVPGCFCQAVNCENGTFRRLRRSTPTQKSRKMRAVARAMARSMVSLALLASTAQPQVATVPAHASADASPNALAETRMAPRAHEHTVASSVAEQSLFANVTARAQATMVARTAMLASAAASPGAQKKAVASATARQGYVGGN